MSVRCFSIKICIGSDSKSHMIFCRLLSVLWTFYLVLHRGKRKHDGWKVSESHKEGSGDISENLHCCEYMISVPATHWIFIQTWLICCSFIPGPFSVCQTLAESLIHAKFHEMQNKTNPLNWAWPRITRADQSHYSFKVGQVEERSIPLMWLSQS